MRLAAAASAHSQQRIASLPQVAAASRRHFSGTTALGSKLGRTPISVPPGVELKVGEPWVKRDLTTYLKTVRKTVTVEGPLGELVISFFLSPR